MREKSLDSEKPATELYRFSRRHTSPLSPYSAIFCHQSSEPSECNQKKANTLPESARNTDPKSTPNSLFQNILRASHFESVFYPECRGYKHRNSNEMSILQRREKKYRKPSDTKGGPRATFGLGHPPRTVVLGSVGYALTPWAVAHAGSDIAESAPPAREASFLRRAQSCARLLHGRLLPSPRVRQFPRGARG